MSLRPLSGWFFILESTFLPTPSPQPPISHCIVAYSPLPVCTKELEAFAQLDSLGCLTHKPADFLSSASARQMVIMGTPQCCRQVGGCKEGDIMEASIPKTLIITMRLMGRHRDHSGSSNCFVSTLAPVGPIIAIRGHQSMTDEQLMRLAAPKNTEKLKEGVEHVWLPENVRRITCSPIARGAFTHCVWVVDMCASCFVMPTVSNFSARPQTGCCPNMQKP